MNLADFDYNDLRKYLEEFKGEDGILRFCRIHKTELDGMYYTAMKMKEKIPIPPNFIVKCKDGDKISLPIFYSYYSSLIS